MKKSATQPGVLDSVPDLIAIEADYRAGVMSVRAVAAKHGVSEGAVRKWAKAATPPWQRDLTAKVQEAARAQLVRSTHHAYDGVRTPTERETVEVGARAVVLVVREHRGAIQAGQQMVGMLLGQLQEAAANRCQLEEIVEIETKDDQGGQRRAMLMRAVSLPQHASTMKDLATAMKHLIGLERQAFGLVDKTDPDPPVKPPETREVEDVDYTELRQAFEKRLGHAATAA